MRPGLNVRDARDSATYDTTAQKTLRLKLPGKRWSEERGHGGGRIRETRARIKRIALKVTWGPSQGHEVKNAPGAGTWSETPETHELKMMSLLKTQDPETELPGKRRSEERGHGGESGR
ncbi:hypothetical protein THAOC_29101 [Thalassiosira oceanica]|uniref:Uncharacterized protein n=1 Tax=Thalassiosira oceanica TaxID=159749 RepID=K0RHI3_THAOC|nr:hypothetical protein THAOC_29101 [Thalassiosira oceanica]|eukprot:EJK51704.1 hypothetical protein THAOC_29101 [Thalassiosira oceanica]